MSLLECCQSPCNFPWEGSPTIPACSEIGSNYVNPYGWPAGDWPNNSPSACNEIEGFWNVDCSICRNEGLCSDEPGGDFPDRRVLIHPGDVHAYLPLYFTHTMPAIPNPFDGEFYTPFDLNTDPIPFNKPASQVMQGCWCHASFGYDHTSESYILQSWQPHDTYNSCTGGATCGDWVGIKGLGISIGGPYGGDPATDWWWGRECRCHGGKKRRLRPGPKDWSPQRRKGGRVNTTKRFSGGKVNTNSRFSGRTQNNPKGRHKK